MAQIPGLPIDEPVALQKAKPAEFGQVGEAIAGLGYETQQMALANTAFEGHLLYAQRQLKYKQIEINVAQLENQSHEALSKTTTPEEAQQVQEQFNKELQQTLEPYLGDAVLARQLHLYSQQVDVQMQHTVNARKATIIQHSDDAANKVLYNTAVQEAVNTTAAGGDPSTARAQLDAKLQSSVHVMGTLLPDQAEAIMQRFDKDVDKGIIKAKYNSPNPATRKQVIEQLRSGEGFQHLDEADINAMLSSAEKRDRELKGIHKSNDYNAAVTQFNDDTDGWLYQNKADATQSNKYLKEHGYVDENGNPDHVMGDKLLEEVNRQQTAHQKSVADKDTEITDKYLSKFDTGKFSDNQIDTIVKEAGGSPKAASALKSASHQAISQQMSAYKFGEYIKGADHRAYTRAYHTARDNGEPISTDLMSRMTAGESIDMSRVWDTVAEGDMTKNQALQVQAHMEALKNAAYKDNATRIANASGISDKAKAEMTLQLLDAKTQDNLQGTAMHQYTDKLLEDHSKKVTSNWIDSISKWGAFPGMAPTAKPARPNGVPDNAVWNPATKTWQLHK